MRFAITRWSAYTSTVIIRVHSVKTTYPVDGSHVSLKQSESGFGIGIIIIIIIINNRLFVFTLIYKNNYDVNSYVRHGMN